MTDTAAAEATRIREFRMPDVGEGLTEAEILTWHVRPGDEVTDGQVVCEVETAKAAVELPIPFTGVVHELRFEEGTTVDVGTPIITVDTDPAAGPADSAGPAPAAAAPAPGGDEGEPEDGAGEGGGKRQPVLVGYGVATGPTKRRPRRQPAAPESAADRAPAAAQSAVQAELNGTATPPAAAPAVPAADEPPAGRPLAKPPVRKLAKDLGVDLAAVVPTGEGGIITREDVHAAAAERTRAVPAPEPGPAAEPVPSPAAEPVEPGQRERRVPIKGVRRATAQAMVSSAFTAPHATEFVTVDVTRTMKLVQELKQDPDLAGLRVNPLLLVAKAFLVAIRRHPEVNAFWDEERQEIVYKDYVNLGIAAATPRGLIVPNIKDAHAKTLPELAKALGELVATAKEGRTPPGDMAGGTVTITNVGVFGVDTGTPILNPGESAILAFGQVRLQPWVHKGKVKPRQVTTLALSFDHRLVDGELGSRVLADTAAVLEHPRRLITWS
ncbi:dihydrolipoamide acetyltransferase family protein [Streptomyces sp. TRM 70361]|uniref:dihydrolipoamide acetyltransferase family protein n=1 Tax=Streptomyces sp. TRM 70361 TaxID=3116553 RepID=UPI002E7AB4EC|nr:dihydrolipoamide acetyltransferase family protein [Streptomyces sp. TRM 70361]MEE1939458.1 dihydrolipoamide acetyltransferase family protein [Streptomyces sp. TRM 70361]